MGKNACCVISCKNNPRNSSCKFYSFPMSKWKMDQRNKWIAAVNRKNDDGSLWQPECYHLLCSGHFIGGQKSDEQTNPSYVPTIFPSNDFRLTHHERRMIMLSEKYPHRYDDQVRDVVYNVYTYFKKECEEFQDVKGEYFRNVLRRVSDATGVSTTYVSKLINEYIAVGPEAFLKPSLRTQKRISERQKNESCDSSQKDVVVEGVVDVKPPQKKRRKKGARPAWARPKKKGQSQKVKAKFNIENCHNYEIYSSPSFIQIDDSNKPLKIVDRSLNELHSPYNFKKAGENSGAPVSIKNEPSSEIDIVEHSLPDLYGGIEGPTSTNRVTNGASVSIKQEEKSPLNNEDPPIPVALISNQITVKNEPKNYTHTVENELLNGNLSSDTYITDSLASTYCAYNNV